jgi:hypothetical protein
MWVRNARGAALVVGGVEESLIHDDADRDEEMASLLPVTFWNLNRWYLFLSCYIEFMSTTKVVFLIAGI